MIDEDWPDIQEFSRRFGISPSTIRRKIKKEELKYKIHDGKYLIYVGEMKNDINIGIRFQKIKIENDELKEELQKLKVTLAEQSMLIEIYEQKLNS